MLYENKKSDCAGFSLSHFSASQYSLPAWELASGLGRLTCSYCGTLHFFVLGSVYALILIVSISGRHYDGSLPESSTPPSSTSALSLPTSVAYKNGVVNGSSFAGVTLLDGSRQVVFQDINGTLRIAVSDNSGTKWNAQTSNAMTDRSVRVATPLSAFLRLSPDLASPSWECYPGVCLNAFDQLWTQSLLLTRFTFSTLMQTITWCCLPLHKERGGTVTVTFNSTGHSHLTILFLNNLRASPPLFWARVTQVKPRRTSVSF